MYLARLHRYNGKLNNVVTFLDELRPRGGEASRRRNCRRQIQRAAARHSLGRERHHLGQGLQDDVGIAGVQGTGLRLRRQRRRDAARRRRRADRQAGDRRAGERRSRGSAVDQESVGSSQGSSGSSAGPSSATAAGCVAFGIGTETSGSILSPSARCGLAGLRPTFGRISRYGVMALSWTQDRLGPICRYAEDCAIVMQAIAKPDGRDMSVSDIPFNWNAQLDIKKLRVGYIKESFDDLTKPR